MRLCGTAFFLVALLWALLLSVPATPVQAEVRGGLRGGSVEGYRGGVVTALPTGAVAVVRAGRTYYLADGVYYQPCYAGGALSYCAVDPPDGDDLDDDDGDEDDGDDDL